MARRPKAAPRVLAGLALFVAACEGPAAFPPIVTDPAGALAALEAETGHTWRLRRHPSLGTPAFLEGRTQPLAATARDAQRAARQFLSQHERLFSLRSAVDDLADVSTESDDLGMSHARFQQRVGHVPVWGSDLLVHFDRDGSLVRVNGRYALLDGPASLEPRLTADEARVAAAAIARGLRPLAGPNAAFTLGADLVVVPLEDGALAVGAARPARLAWRVSAGVADVDAPLALEALIDAEDGRTLAAFDRVVAVAGSGLGVFGDRKPVAIEKKTTAYWLEDRTRGQTPSRTFSARGKTRLPGSEVRSSEADRWDDDAAEGVPGAAVDAHAYVAKAWDYFQREHGRAGWDGGGTGVRAVVHFGDRVANAFFDGTELVFGDGDDSMTAPAAALDVVGHEYTHGIVAATAGLVPMGEPGAINEGLADLFGCLIAWTSGRGDRWQMGETIYHPGGQGQPLRDLAHPSATGQPERADQIEPTSSDQGGVHTNASIVGHLGWMLVEGVPADGTDAPVVGLGRELVGKLFYRALTHYLFAQAGFADLGDALIAAAHDVGADSELPVGIALSRMRLR